MKATINLVQEYLYLKALSCESTFVPLSKGVVYHSSRMSSSVIFVIMQRALSDQHNSDSKS